MKCILGNENTVDQLFKPSDSICISINRGLKTVTVMYTTNISSAEVSCLARVYLHELIKNRKLKNSVTLLPTFFSLMPTNETHAVSQLRIYSQPHNSNYCCGRNLFWWFKGGTCTVVYIIELLKSTGVH